MEGDIEKQIHETEEKLRELKSHTPQNSQQNTMIIPAAIVIAGLIIGGAILFTNKTPGGAQNQGQQKQAPTGQAGQNNQAAPEAKADVKAVSKDDHIMGNPDADIFLIEYSDFECPYCKRFHPTAKQVVDAYGGKVAWVYRHFPLPFHANAQKQAEASECAWEQKSNDGFWAYTNALYERTTSGGTGFALDKLVPLAKELGMNEKTFKSCLDSGKYAAKVQQDLSEGSQAGVNGTPGNILFTKDGKTKMMAGALPFAMFKQEIDILLK